MHHENNREGKLSQLSVKTERCTFEKGYVKNEGSLRTIYECQRGRSKGKFLENGRSFKEAEITMFLEVITMTILT